MVSITGETTGLVTNNPPNQATGDLDVVSIGTVTSQNWTISSPPAFGTASIDPNTGDWTYTVDQVFFDSLDDGEIVSDTFTVQVTGTVDLGFTTFPFTLTQNVTITIEGVCFTAGTLIETESGIRPIETLAVGDHICTADHGLQPIRWIESSALDPERLRDNPAMRPVRINAGSLGPNTPSRDLLVSQQHRILVRGPKVELLFGVPEALIAAKHLCTWPGIAVETSEMPVEYLHILLDNHEILMAEGALAESLYLGEEALHTLSSEALQELAAIFPETATPAGTGFGRAARMILREYEALALA
ncbi:Hint domain-containing protein [Ruegeria lacuscaerulensis]|uniref:Hint domain-containing protein n=1 Tax=Ruegeria lacuscaerulensis TaxID=55218 RepID=UPI00147FBD5D|nr:Hint domain-containing protein [Ruegeria lacuscaerulensis]